MVEALVAGHICLDMIPGFKSKVSFEPGRLIEVGEAALSTGGAVSNTGQALYKLGISTSLCGKIGDDLFGKAVLEILERTGPGLSKGMAMSPSDPTSYSVVINLSGEDRMFLHAPGCNDTFTAADVSDEALANCKLMHFGYPTLMSQMHANTGQEVISLFRRAKWLGATTSLDMSLPDLAGPAALADWYAILEGVLPYTDLFLPNVEELQFMLDRPSFDPHASESLPVARIQELAQIALRLGAKVVGVKAGSRGLYLTSRGDFMGIGRAQPSNVSQWERIELWAPCFEVDVAGTTGAGDATVAGLLMAWLHSFTPEEAVKAATAVGGCCCEGADAVSGVLGWSATEERILSGWSTLPVVLAPEWKLTDGVFRRE